MIIQHSCVDYIFLLSAKLNLRAKLQAITAIGPTTAKNDTVLKYLKLPSFCYIALTVRIHLCKQKDRLLTQRPRFFFQNAIEVTEMERECISVNVPIE